MITRFNEYNNEIFEAVIPPININNTFSNINRSIMNVTKPKTTVTTISPQEKKTIEKKPIEKKPISKGNELNFKGTMKKQKSIGTAKTLPTEVQGNNLKIQEENAEKKTQLTYYNEEYKNI